MHRDFERQYNIFATFGKVRLPREATNARKKARGNCALFGMQKNTVPETVFADFGVHLGSGLACFSRKGVGFCFGIFFFGLGVAFRRRRRRRRESSRYADYADSA